MAQAHVRGRLGALVIAYTGNDISRLAPNPPVNADARGRAAKCEGRPARAGYWER
jgi:hypothetical protein